MTDCASCNKIISSVNNPVNHWQVVVLYRPLVSSCWSVIYIAFFLGITELINHKEEWFVPSVVNGNAVVSRGYQVSKETPVTSTFACLWWIMSHSHSDTNWKINCVREWMWKWGRLATTKHDLIRGPQVWHFNSGRNAIWGSVITSKPPFHSNLWFLFVSSMWFLLF